MQLRVCSSFLSAPNVATPQRVRDFLDASRGTKAQSICCRSLSEVNVVNVVSEYYILSLGGRPILIPGRSFPMDQSLSLISKVGAQITTISMFIDVWEHSIFRPAKGFLLHHDVS